MGSKLLERCRRQSDEKLLDMVLRRSADFTGEETRAAAEVLAERGYELEQERRKLDEQYASLRATRDAAGRAGEQRRAELIGTIASSARAGDRCLLCRDAAAEVDLRMDVRRLRSTELHGSTELRSYDVLPVWIPSCNGCRMEPLFVVGRLPTWLVLCLFFGGLFLPLVLVATESVQALPAPLDLIAFAAPVVLSFGFFGLDWLVVSWRLHRLWRAHPMASDLAAAGFSPTHRRGSSMLEFYASQLRDPFSDLRAKVEAELIGMGTSEVIELAVSLLGHRHATEPALRILVALRATTAAGAIRMQLTASAHAVREAAREALENLGQSAEVPTATLPQARLIER